MRWTTRASMGESKETWFIDYGGIVKLQIGSDNERAIENPKTH